jgi:hypothetical protein
MNRATLPCVTPIARDALRSHSATALADLRA